MSASHIVGIVLLLLLLLGSAMISGAEVALFSLSVSDFEGNDEKTVSRKMAIIQRLLDRPKKLLATILISNNTINIAIVLLLSLIHI